MLSVIGNIAYAILIEKAQEYAMKETKSCFFIGHREADSALYPVLLTEVERYIVEYGVTYFAVGGYGGFDALAARAVKEAKKHHSEVVLTKLLPYHPAERPLLMPDGFDGTYYPFGMERVPRRVAIVRANRIMVEQSDYLIAYAWHPASNARDLVEYAKRREKKGLIRVVNLAMHSGKSL